MYAQLGATVFEGLFSFSEYKKKGKTEFAEIGLINQKPDLQMTGFALDELSLNVVLHISFCTPSLKLAELEGYRINGDILPFLNGYGTVIGNYIIESLEEEIKQTDPFGAVTHSVLDIVLKEYVDPDRVTSKINAAKRAAFALDATSLTLVPLGPPAMPSADVYASILTLNAGASAATTQVKAASTFAGSSAASIKQAIVSVNQVAQAARAIQDKIEGYADRGISFDKALINANRGVQNNCSMLLDSLNDGNIPAALANVDLLNGSVNQLNTSGLSLQELIILR